MMTLFREVLIRWRSCIAHSTAGDKAQDHRHDYADENHYGDRWARIPGRRLIAPVVTRRIPWNDLILYLVIFSVWLPCAGRSPLCIGQGPPLYPKALAS